MRAGTDAGGREGSVEKTARVRISHNGWDVEFAPAVGGAVAALCHDLKPVLRSAVPAETAVLEMSCFPLVPYPNRIDRGRFTFEGLCYELPPNHGDHPHSLHGLGWQSEWKLLTVENDSISMVHRHEGGPGWPWPYIAGQEAMIDDEGVCFRLSLRNDGTTPMPAGLGFHPYFPVGQTTSLAMNCQSVWLTDEHCIPVSEAPADYFADWSKGAPVRWPELIDHCYAGWDGVARIEQPQDGLAVMLSASQDLRHFHLVVPPGKDYFCAEPVSHMPDALNRNATAAREGLRVLEPGETMTAEMRIALAALDRS